MAMSKSPQRWIAAGLGRTLAGIVAVIATVRRPAKPLHPNGEVVLAELHRTGLRPSIGVQWLDQAGTETVLARVSRAIGLPDPAPDIFGLSLRVPADGRHGDLLFASTGLGKRSRFVLQPSLSPFRRPMTTLLPYRTAHGPMVLAVRATSTQRFELLCARGAGPWRHVGTLTLASGGTDAMVSFDPVRNTVPGLDNYPFIRALREPAYRVARRIRR
jgi:hypothetical protein